MSEISDPLRRAFAPLVVAWQRQHGRQGLPWQGTRDPYRVWLSEIMLQQTQVSTVLDYYPRFLQRFPDVRALAAAQQDDVLGLWSGLGYYSRARHLHRCAQEVVQRFGGAFPRSVDELASLPGIGRSTASAIAAFCFDQRASILDGNVKRVLSRLLGYGQDLSVPRHERALWALAERLLPEHAHDMPAYTQALMDLGATCCQPRKAQCGQCPVSTLCVAHAQDQVLAFPVKTRTLRRSSQSLWLLWLVNGRGQVWLQKRAPRGIWAGLYCLPAWEDAESALAVVAHSGLESSVQSLPAFKHVLTHRDLYLHPLRVPWRGPADPDCAGQWVDAADWPGLGLPAPIRTLLQSDQNVRAGDAP